MPAKSKSDPSHHVVRRAQPLLGTLVTIQVRIGVQLASEHSGLARVHGVIDQAFGVIRDIEHAMSAHTLDSDLARLARALPNTEMSVSHHTVAVLRLAKYWHRTSLGAFDPVLAANRLSAMDLRPAFRGTALAPQAALQSLLIVSDDMVRVTQALRLDLGGIAKGYAVDQAIAILTEGGMESTLVNAGGDLRASGAWAWPIQIRSADTPRRTRSFKDLRAVCQGAVATSTAAPLNAEFVRSSRRRFKQHWTSCTVCAPSCVTADALTKWGLQAGSRSPRLRRILRAHGATMWNV